ncbi:hypothetical protein TRICI_005866 [Trichomonascus ciferrii]|uniref:Transcriptional coactivator p15 (PC4) C-terminal domain-containing protein n=1 Tax=Trichomonascus ciferrii TaxID=44093 RepID=A0A642UNN4_9ASCO|nr:hypothetical protein TRICI_005866 [Trichomonascus ciferrii]
MEGRKVLQRIELVLTEFQLGKYKKVSVRSFKGKPLVDIREYYKDKETEEMKPGKKGISLSLDLWKELVEKLPEIQAAVAEFAGEDAPEAKQAKTNDEKPSTNKEEASEEE